MPKLRRTASKGAAETCGPGQHNSVVLEPTLEPTLPDHGGHSSAHAGLEGRHATEQPAYARHVAPCAKMCRRNHSSSSSSSLCTTRQAPSHAPSARPGPSHRSAMSVGSFS